MTSIYVRKPEKYEYPEDFEIFFRQYKTFAKNVKCEATAQDDLMLGFLDRKSYQLVEAITFTDAENTAIAEHIDAALPKLKVALTPPDKMPAKIELKFRKQKLNESLGKFGLAIQNLGMSAFGRDHALNNGQVIDAFCIGVRNTDLSAKLLGSQFENLADAIAFAHNKESSETIKKYVRQNRTCEIDVQDTAGDISVLQTEAENTETQKLAKVTDRNPRSPQYATQSTNPNYRESKQQNSSQAASRRYSFNQGSGRGGVNSSGFSQNHDRSKVNNIQCYICQEFGHYANSCARRDNSKLCHYCGKPGHLQRTCFKKQNNGSGNMQSSSSRGKDFYQGPGNRWN